jgi:hemerythrin-like domain-containing protein
MTEDSVVKIMLRDHGKLTMLLNRLEKTSKDDWQAVKTNFNELRWELEKHFVTEEKAIFIYLDDETQECHTMMLTLLREHDAITKALKGLEVALADKDELDLESFGEMLSKHRDFEDDVFYPRLEKELNEEQQKEIIKTILSPI